MSEQKFELTIADEHGIVRLSDNVEKLYDNIVARQYEADALMSDFRTELLNAMIANNISSATVGKLKCSQVIPSNTIVFDDKQFILNESEDVVAAFTEVETTEEFDLEKFKAEHPDMYKQYTKVTDKPVINTKKLEKALPNVFKKYSSEIKSDKPIRLMIREGKK